jgi:LPXTG-motif cell wall-anchored protein
MASIHLQSPRDYHQSVLVANKAHPLTKLFTIGLAALCFICLHSSSYASADATPAPVTCDGLSAKISDDKNFYIFNATASGDSGSITGYTFDFGDRESYSFNFSSAPNPNHHVSSATHTYRKAGSYIAKVHVNAKVKNKTTSISSASCQAKVTIGPPVATLPNTGATNIVGTFIGSSVVGSLVHAFWLRRRRLLSHSN